MIRRKDLTNDERDMYMPTWERVLWIVAIVGIVILGSCIDSIL